MHTNILKILASCCRVEGQICSSVCHISSIHFLVHFASAGPQANRTVSVEKHGQGQDTEQLDSTQ